MKVWSLNFDGLWISLGIAPLVLLLSACDGGLAPPDSERAGVIQSVIRYRGEWPPADSARDIRFVAMRFVPRDTSDFLELNRLSISDPLTYHAAAETAVVSDVRPGVFVYSGVAVNYAESIFAWRPVGVYADNGGVFSVQEGETTHVAVEVDFGHPPPFPPAP